MVKKMNLGKVIASIATLGVCLVAGSAHAQMSTVSTKGDNGIKVGSGRLHPLFGFETRYDSFVGLSETAVSPTDAASDLILHIKPGLELVIPSDTVEIGARFLLDYNAYTGATESWTSDLSKTRAAFDFNALINPKGDAKVGLVERFARSDLNTNLALPVLTISDRNDAGLHVELTPGGGALLIKPSYVNTYEHFEARDGDAGSQVTRFDYMQHTAGLTLGYKLQPKTALLLDTSLAIRNFERGASQDFDTSNLRVMAGFAGMVAPRITILAKAGYGKQFESTALEGEGFASFIGQAEIGYLYSEDTQVKLGYARSFEPTPSAGLHYSDDRIYLDARTRMGQKLLLNAGISYDQLEFPEAAGRTDDLLGFRIGPDWEFNSVVTAGLSYAFTQRTSELEVAGMQYDRHEVGAHVVVYY